MRIFTLLAVPTLLLASCGGTGPTATNFVGTPIDTTTTPFTPGTKGWSQGLVAGAGLTNPYQLFVPQNYDPSKKWPVILYQHSSGERGTDNQLQLSIGLAPVVRANAATWQAITIFPQVSKTEQERGGYIRAGMEALDSVTAHYNVDPARVYVTGISAGGVYSFEMIYLNPTRFAAFIPIAANLCPVCITGNASSSQADAALQIAQRVPTMAYWQFHGDKDGNIFVGDARAISAAWKSVNPSARYTEYPGVLHDSWTQTYANPAVFTWLFAQHR